MVLNEFGPDGLAPGGGEVTALILAAGRGERLGCEAKAFLQHEGRTLLGIAVVRAGTCCDRILVGLRVAEFDDDVGAAEAMLASLPELRGRVEFVPGGVTRRATFLALLERARGTWTMVHDVARPFATEEDFRRVLEAAQAGGESGAAALCRRPVVRDSLGLMTESGMGQPQLTRVLPRDELVAVQTPQAYNTALLRGCESLYENDGSDDHSIPSRVAAQGYGVSLVWGENENTKITYPEDRGLLKEG